ncbi:MAG: cob(I)yrinic acid a,c-diamide adenosyltransferase [Microgenomates group bacterium]
MTGLVYVFTGEGKGKTSAALGVATRSLLLDKRVVWVAFYKQESWGLAESKLKNKFPNLEMYFSGKGFRIIKPLHQSTIKPLKVAKVGNKGHVVVDTASEEDHKAAAESGLRLAANSLRQKPFLLVMDEVLNAMCDGLLEEKDVLEVIGKRGETHIVLTGRGEPSGRLPAGILDEADLVTECKKIKHPYDKGELAVKGLDF